MVDVVHMCCYKKCYLCALSISRCDGFVVACGTGGWLWGSPQCHLCLRGCHSDNVTVYSEYNSSMPPRRRRCHFGGVFVTGSTKGFHFENLQCDRRRELALGWRRLRLGKQTLVFLWDHKYWYLNSYPIILWSRYFIVNSIFISFQICLL